MKTKLKVAVNLQIVNTREREIDLPEATKYYSRIDDGRFFPRGLVLFAIILKIKDNPGTYHLVEVERNKQNFTDFVPKDDCQSNSWVNNSDSLRKTAFDIFTGTLHGFQEITQEEFETKRLELLNHFQTR